MCYPSNDYTTHKNQWSSIQRYNPNIRQYLRSILKQNKNKMNVHLEIGSAVYELAKLKMINFCYYIIDNSIHRITRDTHENAEFDKSALGLLKER
jgi:hypothetical protein